MKIGMTGTRFGLTVPQFEAFQHVLSWMNATEFHHGDCVGADAEIATYIREYHPTIRIISRPCTITNARAHTPADETHTPIEPLDRNMLIVEGVDIMFAFPGKMMEQQRSGTWFTIRYARKQGVPLAIFWPDGSTTKE